MRLLKISTYFLFILFYAGCVSDADSSSKRDNSDEKEMFTVRDHRLLYFRNMRLPYYKTEEKVKNREFIYRLATRTKEPNYPILENAIHLDQRHSKAYLLLEPNRFFSADSIDIHWQDPVSKNMGDFLIRTDSPENIQAASKRIAEYLAAEYTLFLKKGSGKIQIFRNKNDTKTFMTVVNDFITLTSP